MKLSKSNRNELHSVLTRVGLDPVDFQLVADGVPELKHVTEGYFVRFEESNGDWELVVWPGPDGPEDTFSPMTWHGLLAQVQYWADRVKVEVDEPDLWATVESQRRLTGPRATSRTDIPFAVEERAAVIAALESLEKKLAEVLTVPADLEQLSSDVSFLKARAATEGREAWRMLLLGQLVSWAMSMPEVHALGGEALKIAAEAFVGVEAWVLKLMS